MDIRSNVIGAISLAALTTVALPTMAQQGQAQPQGQQGQQAQGTQQGQAQPQAQQQGMRGSMGQQSRQQARAPEQYRQEQGRVVEIRPVRVRNIGTPNYVALIETQPGRRVVVDVGQQRNFNLQVGTPVSVRGQIVRIGNRGALLLADAVRIGDRVYDVNRPAFARSGGAPAATSSISGGYQRTTGAN